MKATLENFVARGMSAQKAVDGATGQNVLMVRRKWGANPPAWILALAEECDRTGQTKAAQRLGKSSAVVNQALQNKYTGRMDLLEERVRGEFLRETVACPVLGSMSKRDCIDHQARKYSPTNPMRVKLRRACRTCPNRREP